MMKRSSLLFVLLILFLLSSAHAQWQENGVPVSVVTGDEEYPEIISDMAGGSIIVWQTYRHPDAHPHVYAQRLDADGFPLWTVGGVPVCTAANSQHKPQIVSDGTGGAIIAWTDFRNGNADIYAQRIDPDGAPLWELDGIAVCTVQDSFGWWYESRISMIDVSDGAIMAWYDGRTGHYRVYAQRIDTSGTILWTPDGVSLCSDTTGQAQSILVSDGMDGGIAVWLDGRGPDADLYAQRIASDGTGQWAPEGVPVCTEGGDQNYLSADCDGLGGMICTWHDGRGTDTDIYSQRIDGDGLPLWTADGIAICTEAEVQYWPRVAADGDGGAFYCWSDRRNAVWYEHEIYAQRVSPGGTALWGNGGMLVKVPGGEWDNGIAEIILDGYCGALIAIPTRGHLPLNGDEAPSAPAAEEIETVYVQRITGDGTILWQEPGVPLSAARPCCLQPGHPRMLQDGTGGAVITWYFFYDYPGIFAQRVNGSGYSPPTGGRDLPTASYLRQNFPNPFNPVTRVSFSLKEKGHVSLRIYDVSGRLVRILVDEIRDAGSYEMAWDGTNDRGRSTASGTYFCRMEADEYERTVKMVLLR